MLVGSVSYSSRRIALCLSEPVTRHWGGGGEADALGVASRFLPVCVTVCRLNSRDGRERAPRSSSNRAASGTLSDVVHRLHLGHLGLLLFYLRPTEG